MNTRRSKKIIPMYETVGYTYFEGHPEIVNRLALRDKSSGDTFYASLIEANMLVQSGQLDSIKVSN